MSKPFVILFSQYNGYIKHATVLDFTRLFQKLAMLEVRIVDL